MELRGWLEANGLGKYADTFSENEIDFDVLPKLTESDLVNLGMSVGARRRLALAIGSLTDTAPNPEKTQTPQLDHAERRQLTVMFCDMVGSTALSQKLDPEALRELMGRYQKGCRAIIEKFDGYIAQFLGDGIMAYFGWPRAHEDDAERAVRSALEIVEKITDSAGSSSLHVRIGIATGPVVVGETKGGDASLPKLAVGETPNLAARLQALAGADEIVIGPGTHQLVSTAVTLEDMGEQTLKGIVEPVSAWRVTGLQLKRVRFDASPNSAALTEFVGRESELTILLDRWEQAREGEGHVVLLCGEPGIGKSRLVRAMRERVAESDHFRMFYQCSPFHSSTALHPVVEHLKHAARLARDDADESKLLKLGSLLSYVVDDVERIVPLVASLLAIDYTANYAQLNVTPQKQKDLTLKALADQVIGLSYKKPVLMILEDAHWIDPTSQELFDLIMPAVAEHRILFVATYRPEFEPQWKGLSHVTPLVLNRLPRRQARAMIESVGAATVLTEEIIDEIISKTDGVPLFVEELTKAVIESGHVMTHEAGGSLQTASRVVDIPSTLRDSLMARLDRLGAAKNIAQIGACIGREFSLELISAVSNTSEDDLSAAMKPLLESGLVYEKQSVGTTEYAFKHALVQEAAYASLLHSKRLRAHADIADTLARLFPDQAAARPESLAHHYWHAERADEAIAQWLNAGRKAAQRAGNVEAIAHLEKALDALARLPTTEERKKCELAVRMVLGPAYLAVKGWSSREAYENYERARVLCQNFADAPDTFVTIWGIWIYRMTSVGSAGSLELVDELLRLSEKENDSELNMQAHHAAWTAMIWNGRFAEGLEHAQKGLAIYDINTHCDHALRFGGHDPGVCGWGQSALAHWLMGEPEKAVEKVAKGLELGRQLNHAPSLVHGLLWCCLVFHGSREPEKVVVYADEIDRVSSEHGLALYRAFGGILGGWARCMLGETAAGLEQTLHWMTRYRSIQTRMSVGYVYSAVGEVLIRSNRFGEAVEVLEKATILSARTGDRFWDAEIFRLKGEACLQQPSPDISGAETHFRNAIDLARELKARSLELRAAASLARSLREQGKRQEAQNLLAPVYDWFTEGFDTRDLKDAKALLEELAA